eukprot:c8766_g1_i3.p1 GENE.c8766_g1_i3~~c8766_g1_i3.p1  ORF type:complete len:123 (+),score=23.75 c8766_g1_i3:144-512(+)
MRYFLFLSLIGFLCLHGSACDSFEILESCSLVRRCEGRTVRCSSISSTGDSKCIGCSGAISSSDCVDDGVVTVDSDASDGVLDSDSGFKKNFSISSVEIPCVCAIDWIFVHATAKLSDLENR